MGYHPRIEAGELVNFVTTRSLESRLWFVNNPALETATLSYLAKFAARYEAKVYAVALEGNHIQGPIKFPKENRSHFMRDINSCVARAASRIGNHPGGRFCARRYSNEFLPNGEDIEEYFFYTVLQPVKDGLVPKISEYPGYNCFHDAVTGIKRKFKVVRWAEYNAAKRRDPTIKIIDYTDTVFLQYERLPGYENLSQQEYKKLMIQKLERRRLQIVEERAAKGLGFVGRDKLKQTATGSLPRSTKKSTIKDHRPRILCICDKIRHEYKVWYFDIYFKYKSAARDYRLGKPNVVFPKGTYPPHLPCNLKLAA